MSALLRRIAGAKWFQNSITTVIILAGVLVGVETDQELARRHHFLLHVLDQIIIWIFVAEVAIKMGAEGRRPWRYFKDPWNVFDFLIVAACFMPFDPQYAMVLRLARLLRVLKLVRALPKLQILVGALLKSIPSMAYVSLLLLLLFYVYAVAGTFMFGHNDPVHFGSLFRSMQSLFRAVTLEDWTDLMYINQFGCDVYGYVGSPSEELCTRPQAFPLASPAFFITLVLLGTMVVLNLFIGVIMNGMDAAQRERESEERRRNQEREPSLADELELVTCRMQELQNELEILSRRARRS